VANSTVSKITFSDQATQIIKDRIISLEFKPGTRLIVETLSKEINVSMTPIREGLRSLVYQGLVEYDGKSYSVFNPDAKEVMNICDVRSTLECLSFRLASKHMSDREIQSLIVRYAKLNAATDAMMSRQFIAGDLLIHDTVREHTGNARLQELLLPLQLQYWLIRSWIFKKEYSSVVIQRTNEEHKNILEALKHRDEESLVKLVKVHMQRGRDFTLMSLDRFLDHGNETISSRFRAMEESSVQP